MDATCNVQDSIHVFHLVHNMCPGFWVHINLTVFYQVAKRLDSFKLVDEYDDWDNLEQYIKSVQTRNGFDSYLD